MNRGWARAEQGETDAGIQELQRALAAYDATGAKLWRAHFLGLLARAQAKAGRQGEALTTVDEAIALVERTSDNCSAAELHRIRGDVLIAQSKPKPALASFAQALEIARRQQARSWEERILASQSARR